MRLNRLDLNQLTVLTALLDDPSPTRVGQRLNLTQPAISVILRKLRAFFEDPLFVQVGRKLVATPFARQLQGPTQEMILRAESISMMRPQADLKNYSRVVRIAISDLVAMTILAPLLRRAVDEAPLIRFEIASILDSRHHYHEDLDRGDVDLIVVPEEFAAASHPSELVFTEDYICVVWAGSCHATGELSLADYLRARHVTLNSRTVAGQPYDEMKLSALGYHRFVDVAVPNLLMIPQMLSGTDRIATMHRRLARHLAARWPIQLLDCPANIGPLREVSQWRNFNSHDPAITWLRAGLQHFASLDTDMSPMAGALVGPAGLEPAT